MSLSRLLIGPDVGLTSRHYPLIGPENTLLTLGVLSWTIALAYICLWPEQEILHNPPRQFALKELNCINTTWQHKIMIFTGKEILKFNLKNDTTQMYNGYMLGCIRCPNPWKLTCLSYKSVLPLRKSISEKFQSDWARVRYATGTWKIKGLSLHENSILFTIIWKLWHIDNV